MPTDTCIFCDAYLAPAQNEAPHSRTAEHIFAEWFRGVSQHETVNMYLGTLSGAEAPQLMYRPPLTNLKMKNVCRACNNGWMSALECAAEPVMLRVFGGCDVDKLPPNELEVVARWTAKTAITLSYTTPQGASVPRQGSRSLHPDYRGPARFGFFYAKVTSEPPLDNGHLQVVYGSEVGLIGQEIAGTRLLLCLNGHCLIVDFPPADAGFNFDLTESCSMQLWPVRRAAGVAKLGFRGLARTDRVLLALCRGIAVQLNPTALRV